VKGTVPNADFSLGRYCAPGIPSNDDIPRDEMLLAEGLARFGETSLRRSYETRGRLTHRYAEAISGARLGEGTSDWSGAYDGAGTITGVWPEEMGDSHNPDAYAAGAALAMALEDVA
jgi:hypothetical protein